MLGLQTVVSRQINIAKAPAVVTIGMIRGGLRQNIIPDKVEMLGTIRSFDEQMQDDIHERVTTLAESISKRLARRLHRVHRQALPGDRERPGPDREDGADARPRRGPRQVPPDRQDHWARKTSRSSSASCRACSSSSAWSPEGTDPETVAPNHSPRFYVDEGCLVVGVRTLANLACDFLEAKGSPARALP